QAEDGIRDFHVSGVQTCALPISSLRKDEYVADCSDIDDIIVFTEDGKMMVTKVDAKTFVGKDIIHVAVFKKKDKRTIYNLIYRRSEERRVGKERRLRSSLRQLTK